MRKRPHRSFSPHTHMVTRLRDRRTGKLSAPVGYVPRAGGGYSLAIGGVTENGKPSVRAAQRKAAQSAETQRNASTPTVQEPVNYSSPVPASIIPASFAPKNVIINTEVVPVVDTQTKSRSLRDRFSSALSTAYKKTDEVTLGYLPGAQTPTQVRTTRTLRKTEEQRNLEAAQLAAQKQQDDALLQRIAQEVSTSTQETILRERLDQSRTRGLERFGLFRSDEEKAVQELLARQAYLESLSANIPQVQGAFLDAAQSAGGFEAFQQFNDSLQPKDEGFFDKVKSSLGNVGLAVLLVGGGYLAVKALSKK